MYTNIINKELKKSDESEIGFNGSTEDILQLIESFQTNSVLNVKTIDISNLSEWKFDKEVGDFVHKSGKFFKITGCNHSDNIFPLMVQPEIGILGFLTSKIDNVLHFLVQLKNEPGNINGVQLSPTVQATKSNYSQIHGGKLPKYLEYFIPGHRNKILADKYLSEQGWRYYKKRNRNTIIYTENPPKQSETHLWLTLAQIRNLSRVPLLVNSCARSILSMVPINFKNNLNDKRTTEIQNILSKLLDAKDSVSSPAELIPLNKLSNWESSDGIFSCKNNSSFMVVGCEISGQNREVSKWNQPLIKEQESGDYGLLIGTINKKNFLIWRIRNEPGLIDNIEIGPTFIKRSEKNETALFNLDLYKRSELKHSVELAEEGGRFYKSTFNHKIIHVGEISTKDRKDLEKDLILISFEATEKLMMNQNIFTIEARSLWSLMRVDYFD